MSTPNTGETCVGIGCRFWLCGDRGRDCGCIGSGVDRLGIYHALDERQCGTESSSLHFRRMPTRYLQSIGLVSSPTLSELGFSSVLPEEDGEDSKTTTDLPTTKSNHQYADHQLPQPQPDVLLIADCIWLEELVTPLLQTVERILQLCHDKNNNNNNRVQEEPSPVVVLISYQRRGKGAHDAFMNSLKSIFDTV